MTHGKGRDVAYYHDPDVGAFHYGPGHPMKPHRLALTDALVRAYGLYERLDVFQPAAATTADLLRFHDAAYVSFLESLCTRPTGSANAATAAATTDDYWQRQLQRFNFYADCPAFPGLADFCCRYAGASLAAARTLRAQQHSIAINWSGGLHHARRSEASGFCYVNDIVLAIVELLEEHPRVLYVDIDVHHGDGVQEAFYGNARVMTVSFHRHGDGFFPGTGGLDEIGYGAGRYACINVPLRSGIDDASYAYVFEPIMTAAIEAFNPTAIVLQGGADSLGCDRLGCFNLSIRGHGECVRFIRSFRLPLLMLGGGGYVPRNVARCWAYETAVLTDTPLSPQIPAHCFSGYYGSEGADGGARLHPPLSTQSPYASVHLTDYASGGGGGGGGNEGIASAGIFASFSSSFGATAIIGSGNAGPTASTGGGAFSYADGPENFNTRQYLDAVKATVLERIRRLALGSATPACGAVVPRPQDFRSEAATGDVKLAVRSDGGPRRPIQLKPDDYVDSSDSDRDNDNDNDRDVVCE